MNILKKMYLVFGRRDVVVIDADVASTIANMQRDLDAYRHAWTNIYGYLADRFGGGKSPAIMKDDAASAEVNKLNGLLYERAVDVMSKYNELRGNMDSIVDEKLVALNELSKLQKCYDSLKKSYNALKLRFDKLAAKYDALKEKHDELVDDYSTLSRKYNELVERHDALVARYSVGVDAGDEDGDHSCEEIRDVFGNVWSRVLDKDGGVSCGPVQGDGGCVIAHEEGGSVGYGKPADMEPVDGDVIDFQ